MRNTCAMLFALAGLAVAAPTVQAQDLPPRPVPAIAAGVPAAADLAPVFSPAELPEGATPSAATIVFQPAAIDTAFLESVEPGQWIGLNVAPGRTFSARVDRFTRRGEGRYSISGTLDGVEDSFFIIAVEHEAVAGMFHSPISRELYKLKYTGEAGIHLICQVDPSGYANCGGSDPAPIVPPGAPVDDGQDENDATVQTPGDEGDGSFGDRGGCAAPQTVIDGMVAYSDNTRVAMGGTNAVLAEILLTVDVTNLAYSRSGIAARYRVVWSGEVDYAESGNSSTDLGRLGDGGDGILDGLHTTRNTVNADLVSLWVNSLDACGRGYCSTDRSSGFHVVQWDCAAGNFSHPHEMGHNQGCDHNPEDGGSCDLYSYSFGHRFFANRVGYRTIMAYNNTAEDYERIGWFSTPNATFQGEPVGTATRDNARVINNTRGTIESHEFTRMDIWVQIGWSGAENGTYIFPYNTVSEGVGQVDVPSGGRSEDPNLFIKAGTSTYTGTITKTMWVRACGGTVNIGGTP